MIICCKRFQLLKLNIDYVCVTFCNLIYVILSFSQRKSDICKSFKIGYLKIFQACFRKCILLAHPAFEMLVENLIYLRNWNFHGLLIFNHESWILTQNRYIYSRRFCQPEPQPQTKFGPEVAVSPINAATHPLKYPVNERARIQFKAENKSCLI